MNFIIDDYDELKFGDIIWAKRNDTDYLSDIPEGHREGPYIVIGKDGDNLKCFYGSSITRYSNLYRTFVLDNPIYSFDKITYVNTSNYVILSKDRFIKKVNYLTDEDKKNLGKKISTAIEHGLYSDIEIPYLPLESGDIVWNDYDLYLIISEEDDNFNALKLLEINNGINGYIELNGKRYYLDFDNIRQFSKNEELKRYNFVDEITLNKILALQNQRLESFKSKIEISRGSLIKRNDNYYYIYGEIGNDWMAFSLCENYDDKFSSIVIGNRRFYTDFVDVIRFSKDSDVKFIGNASEKEIDEIKKKKKTHIKNEKEKEKKASNSKRNNSKNNINIGNVVEVFENNVPVLYVVILKNEEEVLAIKYNKYINGIYEFKSIPINKINKIGSVEKDTLKNILINIRDKSSNFIHENTLKRLIKKIEN